MSDNIYTAGDIEKLIGISPVSQRERRLRGAFHYFGKQDENKRWKYSAKDMIAIAVSHRLQPIVGDQLEAERMANWIAPEVAKYIGLGVPTIITFMVQHPKDRLFYPDDGVQNLNICKRYALFARNQNPIFTDNATHIADFDSVAVFALDLHILADELPTNLIERLKSDEVCD